MNEQMKWKKPVLIAGAAGFVIAVLVVLIGLVLGSNKPDSDAGSSGADSSSSTNSDQEQSAREGETEEPDGFPVPQLDSTGLAEMAVTTDPRVAAASAASVLMSVDATKVQWSEDFRTESLRRVMVPSSDYVGPRDQLQFKQIGGRPTLNGDDMIDDAPRLLQAMEYSPTGWWWMLGDDSNFQSFQSYGAKLVSTPIEVYDQAEMVEYSDGAYWTEPSDMIEVNLNPGATFGLYWVRVETTTTTGESEHAARNPVALSIYCDPPETGGVCGVVGLMTKYPSGWETSF